MEQLSELLQNLLQSDLVWQILIALAMLLLFRSVPKETLDKLEKRATETETTADDMAIKVLRWLNANKDLLPDLLPVIESKPIEPTPQPVTETVTTTTTVTAPPFMTPIEGTNVSFYTPDETDTANG